MPTRGSDARRTKRKDSQFTLTTMKHKANQFDLPGMEVAFNLSGQTMPSSDPKARTVALARGYSEETAEDFAKWIVDYCPEVQSYNNLFDYFMDKVAKISTTPEPTLPMDKKCSICGGPVLNCMKVATCQKCRDEQRKQRNSERGWKVRMDKQRSTWNWFTTNPQGGGFGSNHCGSKGAALASAIRNIPSGERYELITNGKSTIEVRQ
jgi:hypothetical protein